RGHLDAAEALAVAGEGVRLDPGALPRVALAIEVPAHDVRALQPQRPRAFERVLCRRRYGQEQEDCQDKATEHAGFLAPRAGSSLLRPSPAPVSRGVAGSGARAAEEIVGPPLGRVRVPRAPSSPPSSNPRADGRWR